MNANDWRAKARAAAIAEAQELELPSGMVIKARRPDPAQLLMWNRLPLRLAGEAAAAADAAPEAAMTPEDRWAWIETMRDLLDYCAVDPRITLEAGPADVEAVHPKDIPAGDVLFLIRWALRREEVDALRSFRTGRADGSDRGDRQAVRPAAVDAGGDRGSGAGARVRPGGGDDRSPHAEGGVHPAGGARAPLPVSA